MLKGAYLMKKLLVEGLGTFILVLFAALSGNPLAVGLGLMALIYCGGHISGGHFNPAVSLAFALRGSLTWIKFLYYALAQTAGAFAACAIAYFIQNQFFIITPGSTASYEAIEIIECVGTFFFVLTILTVTQSRNLQGNKEYGMIIGLTLAALIYMGSSISGGCYNPAVINGSSLMQMIHGSFPLFRMGLYTVSQIGGAALATFAYSFLND